MDAELEQVNLYIELLEEELVDYNELVDPDDWQMKRIADMRDELPTNYRDLERLNNEADGIKARIASLEEENAGASIPDTVGLQNLQNDLELKNLEIESAENELFTNKYNVDLWDAVGPEYEYAPENEAANAVSQVWHTDMSFRFVLDHLVL